MNRLVLLATALALSAIPAWAGVVTGGTRVIYPADKKEVSLPVRNPEKSGVYLIQSWVDTGTTGERGPFIVTPPLFRINSGEENLLRIIRTGGNLPQDRESIFWLNVKSIAADDSSKPHTNVLQLVVKTRVKLFYRPTGLPGDPQQAYRQLQAARKGNRLIIRNPTPYYVTLFTLTVDGKEIKEADLVAPFGSVNFALPAATASSVVWQAINDYGGITEPERRHVQEG
ncbi:fimbrial biogenesis chaperone [Atlantibacter subterraneus]|uniref:fimbrial biogenesis chaperone n=1 Tax=Atlantibacter subterraneus TaxID=255519 RepID=UPI002963D657|nr:molecular chaperone [Atlantibacter subterranea]MDW2742554.1 molecular chaperone [Atlantibacter subterranea]